MKSKKRSKVGSGGVLDASPPTPRKSLHTEESASYMLKKLHIAALASINHNDGPKSDKWRKAIKLMQADSDMAEKALQGAAVEVALVQAAKVDAEKNKHLLEIICRTLQARNSALREEVALTNKRESLEREEINHRFNTSLEDMRCQLEKQTLICKEQEEENCELQKKKNDLKESTTLMEKRWETASRPACLEVELWKKARDLQEQELIISRARFEELKRRVHESETSFKRDSADANELLDTLKLYKEAESDALVQLEKEEEEITRLHLEIESMETVNRQLRIEAALSHEELVKEVELSRAAVTRCTSIRKDVDKLTMINEGLRKAKEAAEEEVEELTKQLLKLGKIVPPSPGGEDDKRRECFEGLEKEGNNETE